MANRRFDGAYWYTRHTFAEDASNDVELDLIARLRADGMSAVTVDGVRPHTGLLQRHLNCSPPLLAGRKGGEWMKSIRRGAIARDFRDRPRAACSRRLLRLDNANRRSLAQHTPI